MDAKEKMDRKAVKKPTTLKENTFITKLNLFECSMICVLDNKLCTQFEMELTASCTVFSFL